MQHRAEKSGNLAAQAPLVAHVIYALEEGGLEQMLITLVRSTPVERYRHAIICMAAAEEPFVRQVPDHVPVICLHKKPGQDPAVHLRLFRALRQLRPTIVHSRNIGAMESQVIAFVAGCPGRVHGLHGFEMSDVNGNNWKQALLARALSPFIQQYVTVTADLKALFSSRANIDSKRISTIYNGVDAERFRLPSTREDGILPAGFAPEGSVVIGSVGRMQEVKDHLTLVRAFIQLKREAAPGRPPLRLVIVGEGAVRQEALKLLQSAGVEQSAWLPGARRDVPALMRAFDIFVLPSLAEGMSNTILEAMATGLPVIATRIGGNPELVREAETGMLIPPGDPISLSASIVKYVENPKLMREHGRAGCLRVQSEFRIQTMVERYLQLYDSLLVQKPKAKVRQQVA